MTDVRKFFNQPVKNNFITNDNIRKMATGQGDDCTTGCLLDYNYFNNYYKMIAIDLSKQQELDADPKTIQQIKFTEKKISLSEYTGLSNQTLRSLELERFCQYQTEYYNNMINKEAKESL